MECGREVKRQRVRDIAPPQRNENNSSHYMRRCFNQRCQDHDRHDIENFFSFIDDD